MKDRLAHFHLYAMRERRSEPPTRVHILTPILPESEGESGSQAVRPISRVKLTFPSTRAATKGKVRHPFPSPSSIPSAAQEQEEEAPSSGENNRAISASEKTQRVRDGCRE